jgi:hypothetical protein
MPAPAQHPAAAACPPPPPLLPFALQEAAATAEALAAERAAKYAADEEAKQLQRMLDEVGKTLRSRCGHAAHAVVVPRCAMVLFVHRCGRCAPNAASRPAHPPRPLAGWL